MNDTPPPPTLRELVVATGNTGKLREIDHLLAPHGYHVIGQRSLGITDADETGLTFVENALLKARHASQHSGRPALADDSGLEVRALQGQPGIYSARYAGADASDADNNRKLLQALDGVPDEQRITHFHCVMVYLRHPEDPVPLICQGSWAGRILHSPKGEQGFGYDPLFWVPERECSAAQLSADQKGQLSHRGQALRAMIQLLSHEPA